MLRSPDDDDQVARVAAGGSVGVRIGYCDDIEHSLVGENAPACTIEYEEQAATEQMTVVDDTRVTVTYLEDPTHLLGREGLAVQEPIELDIETTTALGLPPFTMVQWQFAPLTEDADGNMMIALNVGTELIPAPNPETFEPELSKPCCPNGAGAWICSGCIGGNSGENPQYAGSACCFNSIHFNPE